ncbi:MAG: class I tRNA ligase family protein, partial [Muribaculaceae bacterium]|nr:class I tRNA ligase family protein [Muribaculaceae bacterium]
YLEVVKPAYGQPIDKATFDSTLGFFDTLLRLLHPFMPFITEELWQHLAERKEGESIMYALIPKAESSDAPILAQFETLKEVIAGVRTIRKQKQIAQKEELQLHVKGNYDSSLNPILMKMANLSAIEHVEEKSPTSSAFIVGAIEYSIPLESKINVEEELAKLNKELEYYTRFLAGVEKKLSNEKFVNNAPEAVVAVERKKQSDATEKLEAIRASIAALRQ